jgi:hypothetical protein
MREVSGVGHVFVLAHFDFPVKQSEEDQASSKKIAPARRGVGGVSRVRQLVQTRSGR